QRPRTRVSPRWSETLQCNRGEETGSSRLRKAFSYYINLSQQEPRLPCGKPAPGQSRFHSSGKKSAQSIRRRHAAGRLPRSCRDLCAGQPYRETIHRSCTCEGDRGSYFGKELGEAGSSRGNEHHHLRIK